MNMTISKLLKAYLKSAKERRKVGSQSGLPEDLNISLSEALSLLATRNSSYKDTAILSFKDQITDPAVRDIATLCVRFGDLLAPICDFMMATSSFPLNEIRMPIHDATEIDRTRSMVGTTLWVCEKFRWPHSKSGTPLSPLMQINLHELRPHLSAEADFPALLVQVWGDSVDPFVRTIPLSEIEGASPDASIPEWENEHLYYGVNAEASGSAKDIEASPEEVVYCEYIGVGGPLPFSVSRDMFNFETLRYEIECLAQQPTFAKLEAHSDIAELINYLSDSFEEAMVKFELNRGSRSYDGGYFFGDTKLRQSSYLGWYADTSDWHGGGWKTLYQPYCDGDSLPGLSIFWDGELALFWRIKDGEFEFRAEADR